MFGCTNIFGVKDANFDLDLDPSFAEAQHLFYYELKNQKEGQNAISFLKRPADLVNQYEQFDSEDSDAENALLNNLGKEMGIIITEAKPGQTQESNID